MNSMPMLLSLCNCQFFSPRIRLLYTQKLQNLRSEGRLDKRFRQNVLESIKTEDDASYLFKWFMQSNKFQLNQALLQVFLSNENNNITKPQAYFLYLVIQNALDVLDIEIIINQFIYQRQVFDYLLEIDLDIINQILEQSYKFNEGQGTAIMIQLQLLILIYLQNFIHKVVFIKIRLNTNQQIILRKIQKYLYFQYSTRVEVSGQFEIIQHSLNFDVKLSIS